MSGKRKQQPKDNSNPMQTPFGDLGQIMESAQKIAQGIQMDGDKLDINKIFEHVSNTVIDGFEKSGNQIDPASKRQMKTMFDQVMGTMSQEVVNTEVEGSKISLGDEQVPKNIKKENDTEDSEDDKVPEKESNFELLDSDSEADELQPLVDSLHYNLPVSLEEIYTGKVKKLAVNRERIQGKKIVKEKRKIEVHILPGMKDGQEIRFNKEGNEKFGYQSGDIVITLAVNADPNYERIGNNLLYTKNISLYESYAASKGDIDIIIKHLDGSYMVLKSDGMPLHTREGARKIRNGGMPEIDRKTKKITYGDLYIRFNLILPETFDGATEALQLIEKLFPVIPVNKEMMNVKNRKYNFDPGSSKMREVLLEEVTPEDMDQLDYDEEYESESNSEDSHSDCESEDEE